MVWLGLHGLGIQKKMAEGPGCILKEKEAQRGRVIWQEYLKEMKKMKYKIGLKGKIDIDGLILPKRIIGSGLITSMNKGSPQHQDTYNVKVTNIQKRSGLGRFTRIGDNITLTEEEMGLFFKKSKIKEVV